MYGRTRLYTVYRVHTAVRSAALPPPFYNTCYTFLLTSAACRMDWEDEDDFAGGAPAPAPNADPFGDEDADDDIADDWDVYSGEEKEKKVAVAAAVIYCFIALELAVGRPCRAPQQAGRRPAVSWPRFAS